MPQVLIVRTTTTSTTHVEEGLRSHGITPVPVDTDRVFIDLRPRWRPDGTLELEDRATAVVLDDLRAVWYRRAKYPAPDGLAADAARAFAIRVRSFVHGLVERSDVPVFQSKSCIAAADRKPLQLAVARRCGLDVPRTLVSTDGDALRAFARHLGGEVVTKVVTSFVIGDREAPGVVMTSSVDAEDLAALGPCEVVPVVLQEKLDKEREFRVTVVGDRWFACSIDTRGDATASVDWRRSPETQAWKRDDSLPEAVGQALVQTCRALGLTYGAADVIHTLDDRYVFLEVNPAGEYLWVDRLHERAISAAIADHLASLCAHGREP